MRETKEGSNSPEYSEKEILEEIFTKFKNLKDHCKSGTEHLLLDSTLFKKLSDSGVITKETASQTTVYPINVRSQINVRSGIAMGVSGSTFYLSSDSEAIPLSTITADLSEINGLGNLSSTIYLSQLEKGVFEIKASSALERI